ncbi:29219_t:CDS:2, partial [Racocetra persica]
NDPPLVYYRFPIIGHTWRFITDCEKLVLESRQKYGETFSLYVFGQLITVVGKESTHELFKNDEEFSFRDGLQEGMPINRIFAHHVNYTKSTKIVRDFSRENLKNLTSRMQQSINEAISIYIGECVERKAVSDLSGLLLNIISIPIANIIVGEECSQHEDIIETFRTLFLTIVKMISIPPLLSFIHPWLHKQLL